MQQSVPNIQSPEDIVLAPETDPEAAAAAAEAAGLRYVTDSAPGITRRRAGKGFSYRDPHGRPITAREELARLRALAIPPAWTGVWICPDPRGHLQATGRDAHKFDRILIFARALPQIRARIDADLRRHGLPRERVLATVVRLLETTLIRVGNAEYARENKSFGLTTIRHRHVEVNGRTVDVPSYLVRPGEEVRVRPKSREQASVLAAMDQAARGAPLSWIAVDRETFSGKMLERPGRHDIPIAAQEQLIVELYSK